MDKKEIANYIRRAPRTDKDTIISQTCSGKTVLDVGCIGQDRDFNSANWLHNKVKSIASKTDGVDILIEQIQELRQKGYSMYSMDELKSTNNTYQVVLMADVIEHVNDPVSFLSFYASFLSDEGVVLISTPNSNRANNFINILFNNNYSVNPEHTFWFCPKTFAEVVERANLQIEKFYWGNQYYDSSQVKGVYQKFKFFLSSFLIARRTNFSPNMIFILSKKRSDGRGKA